MTENKGTKPVTKHLPYLKIQHDWEVSLNPPSRFWVSSSYNGSNIYTDFSVIAQKDATNFLSSNDDFKRRKWIDIECTNQSQKSKMRFVAPVDEFEKIHAGQRVESIDISPGGQLGLSGSLGGQLRLWDASNGTMRRDLRGHVGDILVSKILPSGQVGMSGSSDTLIKIWRFSDGLCAATLKGHAMGVLSLEFIERGRNFLSTSRDGTLRLWDCATQTCITKLASSGIASMNDCSIAVDTSLPKTDAKDDRDFGTEGKLAICVSEDGYVQTVDVRARFPIFKDKHQEPLNCCQLVNHIAIIGSHAGEILKYDLRKMGTKLLSVSLRESTPILNFALHSNSTIVASTGGGSTILWDFEKDEALIDFTGPNFDPVYNVAVHGSYVYTCCRDGRIRKYRIP